MTVRERCEKRKVYKGEEKKVKKVMDENTILSFAEVSGDTNPIHLDERYAAGTIFERRVVHGMLVASYISAVIGTEFPGAGTIYLEQSVRFLQPIYIGDEIEICIKILELFQKGKALLETNVINNKGALVIEGKALVKLPIN